MQLHLQNPTLMQLKELTQALQCGRMAVRRCQVHVPLFANNQFNQLKLYYFALYVSGMVPPNLQYFVFALLHCVLLAVYVPDCIAHSTT